MQPELVHDFLGDGEHVGIALADDDAGFGGAGHGTHSEDTLTTCICNADPLGQIIGVALTA